jgi:hypothetical protein
MSHRKDDSPEHGHELQDFLVKSLDNLRGSAKEREKYPALDRLLARIEAREHRLPALALGSSWRWLRPILPPLSAAAAGFAGAALALLLLQPAWFVSEAGSNLATNAIEAPVEVSDLAQHEVRLSQSLHRLERAVRGLEKFQPVIESRIEWIEDALQRKHADAYAPAEERASAGAGSQAPQTSKHNGV